MTKINNRMIQSGRIGHFDGIMLFTASTKYSDCRKWSSPRKMTTEPEVIHCLAETIKSKLSGKV